MLKLGLPSRPRAGLLPQDVHHSAVTSSGARRAWCKRTTCSQRAMDTPALQGTTLGRVPQAEFPNLTSTLSRCFFLS